MPLLNVTVTNFKQENITPNDTTSLVQVVPYEGAPFTTGVTDSNTLPRACLITLTPSAISENPISGAEGYFSIGTNDITISGLDGTTSGQWLTYGNPYNNDAITSNQDAYWTTPGMKLQFTEYDPGGGGSLNNFTSSSPTLSLESGQWELIDQVYDYKIGHDFWKANLEGTWLGEPYHPRPGQPATYYKYFLPPTSDNETLAGILEYDIDAFENWDDKVQHIVAVNSMPLNADGTAPQGNRVFLIIVLKENITGSDLMIQNSTISIDIDGSPTFVDFENDIYDPDDWDGDDECPECETGDNPSWTTSNEENSSTGDGGDGTLATFADLIEALLEDMEFEFSVGDSDDTLGESDPYGTDGLSESEYNETTGEVDNTTEYNDDAYLSAAANSEDEVNSDGSNGSGLSTGLTFSS
tara:strand:+ start:2052 stop:3287 length:1236 start_codon:yes stop_codon:yes gene_type:complete